MPSRSPKRRLRAAELAVVTAGLLAACTNGPSTPTVEHVPAAKPPRDLGEVLLFVALSGGGTRAASFGYGVLETLRDTRIPGPDGDARLLDELDNLAGVSGGSILATYYGLHGDATFDEFEHRFLRHRVQRDLIAEMFRPARLPGLMIGRHDRSAIAEAYYDRRLFGGATLAELDARAPAHITISATDVSTGTPFVFDRDQLGLMCIDRAAFPVARAVAASAAVPGLLTPVTLENHAGSCDYVVPPWVDAVLERRNVTSRRHRAAARIDSYRERERRRYIHLADGGAADNLGVRATLDPLIGEGGLLAVAHRRGIAPPRRFAVIIADAGIHPERAMDTDPTPPNTLAVVNTLMGNATNEFALETVELLRRELEQWGNDLPPAAGGPMPTYLIDLRFGRVADPAVRDALNAIPTALELDDATVDLLRRTARSLLHASPDFRRLVADLSAGGP